MESNPYRLAAGVAGCTDSGLVLRLLREGLVAEALEVYRAPLLSRSGVLAVQQLRDQLDMAVGSAVRSSGDAGLIIRWLSTDIGTADADAVERWNGWWGVSSVSTIPGFFQRLSVTSDASFGPPLRGRWGGQFSN